MWSSSPELRDRLHEPVESDRDIVVDLTEATFLESEVVSELIFARQRVERAPGHRLVLVAPPDSAAAGLLDIIDRDRKRFRVFATRAAAVDELSPPRRADG